MKGIESGDVLCVVCHRGVSMSDATYADAATYHDHCFRMTKGREVALLGKKKQLGTITLAEANLEKDLLYQIDMLRHPDIIPINKKDPFRFCQKPGFGFLDSSNFRYFPDPKGNPCCGDYIKLPTTRIDSYKSVQEGNLKRLDIARSERWGWEMFNFLDLQLLLAAPEDSKLLLSDNHDKLSSFPLENTPKTQEKVQCRPIAVENYPKFERRG